jgi:two-component system CheB/CheR fusion protein
MAEEKKKGKQAKKKTAAGSGSAGDKKSAGKKENSADSSQAETSQQEKGKKNAAGKKQAGIPPKSSSRSRKPSFIVGIGSSAGGLEALKELFQHVPADSGMGFVLVPHLDPTTKSIMHELLGKYTEMPVMQVEDATTVEAGKVYIIPPDRIMQIEDGILYIDEYREQRGQRHPIDYFFRSLARDQKDRAIGIILSGTGSEGVVGIKDIKGQGGFVIVQDPNSAKFDGMPLSSLNTGLVDKTSKPQEIPELLMLYAERISREEENLETDFSGEKLQQILDLLRRELGHDFSQYKPKTVVRRIARRMGVNHLDKLDDYIRFIRENSEEINLLFREILIRVTSFFRDAEAFDSLKNKVLPYVMQYLNSDHTLRIWVPACSTGEEAYSVAIVAHEFIRETKRNNRVQVFATDIDLEAVEKARSGTYPLSISVDVSEERLKHYFSRDKDCYRVNKEIRETIIFANQNVINDPPLSRMDLICCRNLLIYLGNDLQRKLLSVFHYALKPSGMLFLGSSETIGSRSDLFTAFDNKWKMFKPVSRAVDYESNHLFAGHGKEESGHSRMIMEAQESSRHSISDMTVKMLYERYAPPSVIIRGDGTILYFSGKTGMFLEPSPGRADLNIFNMARPGLKNNLMLAVKNVRMGHGEAMREAVEVKTNGGTTTCNLRVTSIKSPEKMKGLIMVAFEDAVRSKAEEKKKPRKAKTSETGRVRELEEELRSVKEDLQSTIEELETSNEELQSSNEELQSTNEELETSREELQSVNEELMTVNAEGQERIERLTEATNDMRNLLNSTRIATLFLDLSLRVKSFTPPATGIFKLIQSDIGRPVSDITNRLCYENLYQDMNKVLDTLVPMEKEIVDNRGYWYLMKILPYRTHENRIDGVIVTFIDISRQKHVESALSESRDIRDTIRNKTGKCLVLVDRESGFIVDSNSDFLSLTGKHAWELKDMRIWDLMTDRSAEKTRQSFNRKANDMGLGHKQFIGTEKGPVELELKTRILTIDSREYLHCICEKAKYEAQ